MTPHQSTSLILLCTTSYDELTCFLSKLLASFSYAGKLVYHVRLASADESYQQVIAQYPGEPEKVVLIFCGHGEEDALLTSLKQDCNELHEEYEEEVFYNATHFDSGPDVLATFCPKAGKDLGFEFADKTGGTYLGLCDELWISFPSSEECNAWWRKILYSFINRVIEDENVDEQTIDFVRSVWMEAYDYYCSEKGKWTEESIGMRLCLRRNLEALCRY
jgi:hypothetical protein